MADATEICLEVRDHIPDILKDWEHLAEERPWLELPGNVGLDHLPEVVDALVAAGVRQTSDNEDSRHAVARYALKHGRHRREQGFEDHSLFQEYHLLREAIWTGIRRRYPAEPESFEAIARLDTAITAATRASLHGFHVGHGDDDEALVERLVAECSWPLPTEADPRHEGKSSR